MWKLFFQVCNFLCNFIPNRRTRERIRREKLYDWRKKYKALRAAFPELNFHNMRMIKGGWNIGFIVDNRYVFKIRKYYDKKIPAEKIMREKRITDAFEHISPLIIPKIELVESNGYTFYKYNFIPGKNMNWFSKRAIEKHAKIWGKQLAEFISAVHNTDPKQIADLKDRPGDGWNHNDICNNVIVNKKTMKIVGIIDWEYAGWGTLDTEFKNSIGFSHKVKDSGIGDIIQSEYAKIQKKATFYC